MEYTEHERDQARACGCKSCQTKYDLPPKDPQGGILDTLAGIGVLAALGFGIYKLAQLCEPKENKAV